MSSQQLLRDSSFNALPSASTSKLRTGDGGIVFEFALAAIKNNIKHGPPRREHDEVIEGIDRGSATVSSANILCWSQHSRLHSTAFEFDCDAFLAKGKLELRLASGKLDLRLLRFEESNRLTTSKPLILATV